MKNKAAILELLQAVSNQTVDRTGLNQLIELTQHFAGTYLRYRYKNLSRLMLAEDITLNEMSVHAIASLFERDENGVLIRIKKAFLEWDPPIESEESALFFINSLAARSAEKFVSEVLRESDPFFTKILRNVNYLIESRGYKKIQILGTTYIALNGVTDISRLPSHQFIYDLPLHLFSYRNNILDEIFSYIKKETDKTEAIPLNALIIRIKKAGIHALESGSNTGNKDTFEIESLVSSALSLVFNKLEISYVKKYKLGIEESEALKRALKRIVVDMQDGGINTGLHKYLIQEIPHLSFEDYRTKYQNIFEYLYKLLKKEIIRQMED